MDVLDFGQGVLDELGGDGCGDAGNGRLGFRSRGAG